MTTPQKKEDFPMLLSQVWNEGLQEEPDSQPAATHKHQQDSHWTERFTCLDAGPHHLHSGSHTDFRSTSQWSFRSLFLSFLNNTPLYKQTKKFYKKNKQQSQRLQHQGFPGDSVVKSLPASAGDMGSISNPGRSRHRATKPVHHSCWARAPEPAAGRTEAHAP